MTDSPLAHHVYLIPGLFGFGKLAGYDYFEHLERELAERFRAAGVALHLTVVTTPPTASMPARAQIVAKAIAAAGVPGSHPIHLIGHSTGGLDARLLLSPGVRLPLSQAELAWTGQVRSVITINTPHYGTPLAGYFTTTAGTRMLYVLSLLTVASLGIGQLPLSAVAAALRAFTGLDARLGLELKVLDELTTRVLHFVGEEGRDEIRRYLQNLKYDQAGIMQLMPEVMELFNATVSDHPGVRYGCVATASPPPGPGRIMAAIGRPISSLHLAAYTLLYGFASSAASRYPYASPTAAQTSALSGVIAGGARAQTVDGIVPTLSMLWGELLWCGVADHLDIVGHFGHLDPRHAASRAEKAHKPQVHVDWLRSGASFGRREFTALADALGAFLLREPAS